MSKDNTNHRQPPAIPVNAPHSYPRHWLISHDIPATIDRCPGTGRLISQIKVKMIEGRAKATCPDCGKLVRTTHI